MAAFAELIAETIERALSVEAVTIERVFERGSTVEYYLTQGAAFFSTIVFL